VDRGLVVATERAGVQTDRDVCRVSRLLVEHRVSPR
jgi:hypothetical protein